MPRNQGSGFWGGKQYQDLASLYLPGPSVVIDVRQGSEHDPPLIWNLAIELEDLTADMRLNEVYRWRNLTSIISILKLAPLHVGESVRDTHNFVLTTHMEQSQTFEGREALLKEIGEKHLNRVRNNRIGAVRDRSKELRDTDSFKADPEHATVRVFFIVDAEDKDSMASAATYAKWLKEWYHEYEEQGRSGRDKRLNTQAICMNADPHRHHPHVLAQHFDPVSGSRPALDSIILLHTYGDDEAFIEGNIQSYQVELLLYVLLLLSSDGIAEAELNSADEQQGVSLYEFDDDGQSGTTVPPWSMYMMGISSLEYSARWGERWLDYGLVANLIALLYDAKNVEEEQKLGRLRLEVQEKLSAWQQNVFGVIPDMLTPIVPELQVLDELQGYLTAPIFRQKTLATSGQELQAFSQAIEQCYTGNGNTLEKALASTTLLPLYLANDGIVNEQNAQATEELRQQLRMLVTQAAQMPATLFHGAHGMLPRSLRQMAEFTYAIAEIQKIAADIPDLYGYRTEFRRQVRLQQDELTQLSQQSWLSFKRNKLQEREKIEHTLKAVVHTQYEHVRTVIAAKAALVLLEAAGLYDSQGKICRYHQRLKSLDKAMSVAQIQAALQQQRAHERLQLSLSRTELGVSQETPWLSLNSRKDLLDWDHVRESFAPLYKSLISTPTSLNLLMQWLLQLLGTGEPLMISQEYIAKLKAERDLSTEEEAREQLSILSTLLVDVLLLLDIVTFDLNNIQPLLQQYIDLRDRSLDEPSVLESNILGLQRIVKETLLEQVIQNNQHGKAAKQSGFSLHQSQPVERVLAAWINNQCTQEPLLTQTLERNGVLERLLASRAKPAQILDDLQERNRVLGYREEMTGEDRFFLLLAPGSVGETFLEALDMRHSTGIRAVRFPDAEKLIYLHMHRIHHILPHVFPEMPKQLGQNI